MAAQKIVLIGAGSGVFTASVLADLIRCQGLAGSTVALCDLDLPLLEDVYRLAQGMVRAKEADLRLEYSPERRDVLAGADFVISTIQVGGHEAWKLDVEIPWKHGIWQPVGDSVGPGGLSRALRTVPVMLAIARDMERLCPQAWLINYTNPLTVLCRAVHRETTIRVAGLGTSIPFYAQRFARLLEVEPKDVSVLAAGLNHFSWLVDLRCRGEDAYPLLRRQAAAWKDGPPSISAELLDTFGLLPLPSANHVAEFLPWFLGPETGYGERYGLRELAPWKELAHEKASFVTRMAEYRETGEGLEAFFAEPLEQGGAIDVVDAIANNRCKLLPANIPNDGLVTNMPPEAIIELYGYAGAFGIRGLAMGDLPPAIAALESDRVQQIELTLDAALSGDRRTALEALLHDALTRSVPQAKAILDELLAAHASYLPQFS